MMSAELPLLQAVPAAQLAGRRVLLRLDLNVPLAAGRVADDFRLRRILPTLKLLKERQARTLVVSHIGPDGKQSLTPVARHLDRFLPVSFAATLSEGLTEAAASPPGGILILENIRREEGEFANSSALARRLAAAGELYVNEAFSASHRRHASIVGLPRYLPSFAGLLFAEEVENLSSLFSPPRPFTVIVGGAKLATKLPLIKKFLALADEIFVYGALAHPFFKLAGYEIGRSLLSPSDLKLARPFTKHLKIRLPQDMIIAGSARRDGSLGSVKDIGREDKIMDAGPESLKQIAESLTRAKTVLWNGPLGYFEDGFAAGTHRLARLLTQSRARTVIGGGDTVASIQPLNLLEKFSFVSTGGGAMLDFLASGTLPGIEALRQSQPR